MFNSINTHCYSGDSFVNVFFIIIIIIIFLIFFFCTFLKFMVKSISVNSNSVS
jgi:hypothetical protein